MPLCLINWHNQNETWMNKWIAYDKLSWERFKTNVQLFSKMGIEWECVCVYIQLSGNVSLRCKEHIQISGDVANSFQQSLHTMKREEKWREWERYAKLRQLYIYTLTISKMSVKYGYAFGDMPFAIVFASFSIDEYDVLTSQSLCVGFFVLLCVTPF